MSKNHFDAKFEEELIEVEDYSMASMMARRGHEYMNKPSSEFYARGFSICITSSNDGAKLSLLSDKDEILSGDVLALVTLMKTYREILLPFFPELEKKEAKEDLAFLRKLERKGRRSVK